MNRSTKAALLSAFVFPGVGHLYLKRYVSATVLIGATLAALYGLASGVMEQALLIVERIHEQGMPLDLAALTTAVTRQLSATDTRSMNFSMGVIVVYWFVAVVDSIRIGHSRDRNPRASG